MAQESKLENAILRLRDIFPFPGYIEEDSHGIRNVASTVMRYARPGARVLDFGSGPMDKTAALQLLGYRCSATDDLQDFWHLAGDNRDKILGFGKTMGIDFHFADHSAFESNSFDMAIMCDVLEHIHDSPRTLLNNLLRIIKPQGYLMILVPNAVNLRKRIAVLCGRTNLPKYSIYYWSGTPFRGHVREYVKDDLVQLSDFLGVTIVELKTCHNMLRKLPAWARLPFRTFTALCPGCRDSWILVVQKPSNWEPRPILTEEEYCRIFFEYCSLPDFAVSALATARSTKQNA